MRYLVSYALFPDQQWDLVDIEQRIPIISRPDLQAVLPTLEAVPRRIFKSHDPFCEELLKGKVAYLVRDGRDAMVSLYNYHRQIRRTPQPPFDVFVRRMLGGQFQFGSWQKHVERWLDQAENPKVLLVRYEHMVVDAAAQLQRVLEHFGMPVSEDRLATAVERSTLQHVNSGFQHDATNRGRQFKAGLGGGSGRWREYFSEGDIAFFMEKAGPTLERLERVCPKKAVGAGCG